MRWNGWPSCRRVGLAALIALGNLFPVASAQADWIQTVAGTYEYNDTANWLSGTIDDSFPSTLSIAGDQVLTFNADRALPGAWSFLYDGTGNLTLRGITANRTATLGGNFTLDSVSNARTVTIGSATANENLNVALGAVQRTFNIGTGDTAAFLNNVTGGVAAGNVAILKQGAGTLVLGNATTPSATSGNTFTGNIQIDSGVFAVYQNEGSGTANTILGNAANDITLNGGTFLASLNHGASGRLASGRVITVNNVAGNVLNNPTRLNLGAANQLTGTGSFTKTGAGSLDLFNAMTTFTGTIDVNGGSLNFRSSSQLGSGAAIILSGGGVVFSAGAGLTINNPVTVTANTTITSSKDGTNQAGVTNTFGSLTIGSQTLNVGYGGNVTSGSPVLVFDGTHTLTGNPTFSIANAAGTAVSSTTLTGPISGTGFGFTKTGPATMNLAGTTANTFDGLTTVTAGTLNLNKTAGVTAIAGNVLVNVTSPTVAGTVRLVTANQISDTSAVQLQSTTANLAVLDLNGQSDTIGSLADGPSTGGGRVTLGGGTLTVGSNNTSTSYSGTIVGTTATPAGAGSLVKTGSGTLTLSGTNQYTTATTISGGTLVAASASALGTSSVSVGGTGQVLAIDGPSALTVGGLTGLSLANANTLSYSQQGDAFALTSGTFALGDITLDLNNAFNTIGLYTLIDGVAGANSIGNTTFANADTTNYTFSFAVQGDNGVLTVAAIPEPASIAALASAMAGLALLRRRRLRVR